MRKISEFMTEEPVVAEVPGTRSDVLKMLAKKSLTGVPVVRSSDGELVGFVTRQDIFMRPEEEQLAIIMRRDYPTIGPDDDVKEAASLLIERRIRHLPVVSDGRLVGIITPTDLLIAVEKSDSSTLVEEIVKSTCVPIYQEAPLVVALTTFKVAKVNALPVLDDDAKLTGIITDRDIFNQSLVDGAVVMSELGIANDEDNRAWTGLRNVMNLWYEVSKIDLPKLPVKEVMIRDPVTVFSKTPVTEAAKIMRKNDFGQLPLRDSRDNLIGMIYDTDIISILLK